MLATAHGDGQVRPEGAGNRGGASGGHGLVQRAGQRRTIDLASGVRWERLTPGADERVDFLEVIYEPSGHSTDMRRPLRHDGQEYGLIISGRLQASVGFETLELGAGDSIAFDSSVPHQYWNTTDADVHAIWVVVHAHPGRPGRGLGGVRLARFRAGGLGRSLRPVAEATSSSSRAR